MGHAQLLVCLFPWCLPPYVDASFQLAVLTEIPIFSFEMQATSPYLPARRNNHVSNFISHVVELIDQAMSSTICIATSVTKHVGIYFSDITLSNFLKD